MNIVLKYGAEYVDQTSLTNLLHVIEENFLTNGDEFGAFLVETYKKILVSEASVPDSMLKLISWVLGEIGSKVHANQRDKIEELLIILSRFLDETPEDDLTKGWVLNAMAKLSVCPACTMPPEVLQKYERYSRSKLMDLQQRSLEYGALPRYCGALNHSSSMKVDSKLGFLATFVEQAKARGAPQYSRTKLKGPIAILMNLTTRDKDDKPTLNVTPYAQQEKKKPDKTGAESGVIVHEKKWGAEGYDDKKPEPPKAPPKTATTGFGSADAPKGGWGPNMGNSGSSKDTPAQAGPSFQPWGQAPKKNDAEEQKRKELESKAQGLFGGLTVAAPATAKPVAMPMIQPKPAAAGGGAGGLFGGIQIKGAPPATGGKPAPFAQPTQTAAPAAGAKPAGKSAVVDLLDLDFGAPAPAPAPVVAAQPVIATPTQPLWGTPAPAPAPVAAPAWGAAPSFQPVSFPVGDFETMWTGIQAELTDSIVGKIRSEAEAKAFIGKLNFGIIGVDGSELLTAGKNGANELVLMYLNYGEGNLIVKSANQKAMQDVIQASKSFIAGGAPAPVAFTQPAPPQAQPRAPAPISDSLI